jgi:hypothetical protein
MEKRWAAEPAGRGLIGHLLRAAGSAWSKTAVVRGFFRFLGIWLLAAAVVAVVIDGTRSIADSALVVTPLGQTWFQLHPTSLNGLQVLVERNVSPYLWDPVITTILRQPTAVVAAVLALVFLVAGRPKRDVLA